MPALFYLLQLSRVEVVILFAVALNDPPAKYRHFQLHAPASSRHDFQLSVQKLLFVGQSSLRSDGRSTAKSITTSALSVVRLKELFRSDREQEHRCSGNGSNEFVAIVNTVAGGERGSDFYAGSDCLR